MRTTWVAGLMILFLCGTIISQTLDYQAGFLSTGASGTFWSLLHPEFVTGGSIPIIGFFIIVWNWILAIWHALSWDYAFLEEDFEILRYAGWCLSIALIITIVFAIRGVGSS